MTQHGDLIKFFKLCPKQFLMWCLFKEVFVLLRSICAAYQLRQQ